MRINQIKIMFPIVVAVIFLSALTKVAKAEDLLWVADREKLARISDENCQEAWDILWPWAKKGNLEARLKLLGLVQWGIVTVPGHADSASRWRDMSILTIHSSGYEGNIKNVAPEDPRLTTFVSADFQIIYRDFLECYQKGDSIQCAEKAVKNKRVPSFSDYAEEIDGLVARGHRAYCLDYENRKELEARRGYK